MFFWIGFLFTRIGTVGIMEVSKEQVPVLRLFGAGRDADIWTSKQTSSRIKLQSSGDEDLPTTQNKDP